jgi:predicted Zn-dependent protease
MPKLRPSNVAHAAITNHLISLPSASSSAKPPLQPGTVGISAWRSPESFADRNLALATFQLGADKRDSREILKSYGMMSHLPERDPVVMATLGSILLEQGYLKQAIHLFLQTCAAQPRNARYAFLLGSAYAKQGNQTAAIEQLRRSISIDPSSPDPYRTLATVYEKAGEPVLSKQVTQDYLRFMPQNIEFREKH